MICNFKLVQCAQFGLDRKNAVPPRIGRSDRTGRTRDFSAQTGSNYSLETVAEDTGARRESTLYLAHCRIIPRLFQCRMAWIIINAADEPLTDIDGALILVDTEAAAREWLMRDDERVENYETWIERSDK